MNHSLKNALAQFANKYQFAIDDKHWSYLQEGQRHEIEEGLFSVFDSYGTVAYAETGATPCEYLPDLIDTILNLLDENWQVEDVDSGDEWQTALVELVSSANDEYQFVIDDVNDSDWVPADLFIKLRAFSKAKCNKTFMTFFSDDPYLILALPHQAADELESIIEQFSEPYEYGNSEW
jgi:hypothetical protein